MAKGFLLSALQRYGDRQRAVGLRRCDDWVGQAAADLEPDSLLDVGCGNGAFLFRYFKKTPRVFVGIEGSPPQKALAESRGIKVVDCDLNGRWPFESEQFDVVFSSQVIEHLHNSRLFAEEAFRVLKPGGTAVIASENLCSLLNCMAMIMGYTPFSLMQTCGRFLGNPLGLHYHEPIDQPLPIDHPAFAGVSGHVRVMTVRQAKELFEGAGFKVEARSVAILPLPDGLSQLLEKFVIHKGHFLVLRGKKPANLSK